MSNSGERAVETGRGLWPPPRHAWIAAAGVGLIYVFHLLFGALVGDVALTLSLLAAALLAATLATPGLRADLVRLRGLETAGVLLLIVLAVGAWSLTPLAPGGVHPIWSYVQAQGASTVDRSATIVEMVKLLGLACVFLLGAAAGGRDDRGRWAAQLTVWAGALFGLWAMVVAATGAIYQTQGHRMEALFLNPNTAGNVLAALFVLSVALLSREVRSARRRSASGYLAWLSTFALGAALLSTASRGAATAALVALVAFLVLQLATGAIKPTRVLLGALAGLALLALLVFVAGDLVVQRFYADTELSAEVRQAIWATHWRAFLASPLLGYGLGSFEPINKSLIDSSNFEILYNLRAPLQLYLQWLEEAGLFGAIPMFLCVGWLIWLTLRGLFRRSRMTSLIAGLVALDLTFLLHGFTDSALLTPSVAAFWAWALGLQVALAQGSSRR